MSSLHLYFLVDNTPFSGPPDVNNNFNSVTKPIFNLLDNTAQFGANFHFPIITTIILGLTQTSNTVMSLSF